MQQRSVTATVLIVLLAATCSAAYFFRTIQQHTNSLIAGEQTLSAHAVGLIDALAAIGTAQQSYVAPGQLDEPWFEESSALLLRLDDQIAALRPMIRSADAAAPAQALAEGIEALRAADARTRENLGRGQELMAADVIYSDGRNLVDGLRHAVRDIQAAERASYSDALAAASRNMWLVLGSAMLVWTAAVAVLIRGRRPSGASAAAPEAQQPPVDLTPPQRTLASSIDFSATAALCTDLSRVDDTAALTSLLVRAASVLHASGLMLWMSAGEQLFAALAHGYPPDTLPRLGPIPRDGDNAAAHAWRTGRPVMVPSAGDTPAAIVAPLFNPGLCIGVLAVEMSPGHSVDGETEAAVTMIAAQLATIVAAWPAASLPENAAQQPEARSA